jgi:hypothetical protein
MQLQQHELACTQEYQVYVHSPCRSHSLLSRRRCRSRWGRCRAATGSRSACRAVGLQVRNRWGCVAGKLNPSPRPINARPAHVLAYPCGYYARLSCIVQLQLQWRPNWVKSCSPPVCVGIGVAGLPVASAGAIWPVPQPSHSLQADVVDGAATAHRHIVLLHHVLLLGCAEQVLIRK